MSQVKKFWTNVEGWQEKITQGMGGAGAETGKVITEGGKKKKRGDKRKMGFIVFGSAPGSP